MLCLVSLHLSVLCSTTWYVLAASLLQIPQQAVQEKVLPTHSRKHKYCHEWCWLATFMGILYSPSKVLMASETVLAFGRAKTCSTTGFSHSFSSTVPSYGAWNDCAWMELLSVQHLDVLTLAASAHLLAKRPQRNEAQKNRSACIQVPATKRAIPEWPRCNKREQHKTLTRWTSLSLIPLPLQFCQCRGQGQMRCWEKMKPTTGAKELSHRIRLKSILFPLWLWQ